MSGINRSVPKITITSADGGKTVDISKLVQTLSYFEDLFSPMITVHMIIVSTGINSGKSIYQSLPIVGGERVKVSIPANSDSNIDIELDDLYVQSVSDYISGPEREVFNLNLVTREAISNETSRVGKRYAKSAKISDHVKKIIKDVLESDKKVNVDDTMNPYGFIGNMKKPFTVITWLASKSVPVGGEKKPGGTAGYFFYETKDGYNFRSIDSLASSEPFSQKYYYRPGTQETTDSDKNFNILEYTTNRNNNLISNLERGSYCTHRMFFDPLNFTFTTQDQGIFKKETYAEKTEYTGKTLDLPMPPVDGKGKSLGDLPSRLITGVLDIGTTELNESETSTEPNADPMMIQSQAMMRYNVMFSSKVEMTIPLNTNLTAGSLINCVFPEISRDETKKADDELAGLYMIKELVHFFNADASYTKVKLVKDTFGKKN